MRLLWLADQLRAEGLTVVEHAGWQDRVRPGSWVPRFGVVHATAAPRTQLDADQVRIVRDGRADLVGPIAVACVDRTGRWHVLGSGRCNTTLDGTAGPFRGLGNEAAIGVEACNDNGLADPPEPWPVVQYWAYAAGWAAICRKLGWPAANLVGHKEHTPGHKSDPTFSMPLFRAQVDARIITGGADMLPDERTSLKYMDGRLEAIANGRDSVADHPSFLGDGDPVWIVRQLKAMAAELTELREREPAAADVTALAEALRPHLKEAVREVLREGVDDTG